MHSMAANLYSTQETVNVSKRRFYVFVPLMNRRLVCQNSEDLQIGAAIFYHLYHPLIEMLKIYNVFLDGLNN